MVNVALPVGNGGTYLSISSVESADDVEIR